MNYCLNPILQKFNRFLNLKALPVTALLMILTGCTGTQLLLVNSLARFDDYTAVTDLRYDKHKLNRLSLYIPAQPKKNFASVVFLYGGCWGGCETLTRENYVFVAQALTSKGYSVIIPDYRHYPEAKFDAIMADTKHAVEWVQTHIAGYGGDPKQIFLMGHSAGAHLAAMLTLNETYLTQAAYHSLKGFIGLAGPYDFLPLTADYQKIIFGPEQNYPASQPINFVNGSEPPLLLLYGKNDVTVKPVNIASLSMRVKQAGGCVESHEYKNLDHVDLLGSLTLPIQDQEPVLKDIVQFLDYYSQTDPTCKK